MHLTIPFVLASGSPRRQHLLEQLGFSFEVVVSDVEEHVPRGLAPADVVQHLALEKGTAVSRHRPEALTLAADTVVVHRGTLLGKPADGQEAAAMLRRLSGETHTVFTGLALLHPAGGRRLTAFEATDVTFGPLSDDEIAAYVATGSPLDKAGAYGIQEEFGACFVARIDGDFYTVMGLPLHRLYRMLRQDFNDYLAF